MAPTPPRRHLAETAAASGVPIERLDDWYAQERYQRGLASCTTGWRQAAGYARRGPEFQYYRTRGINFAKTGEPRYESAEGAVLLLSIPWNAVADPDVPADRRAFLPADVGWPSGEVEGMIRRTPMEVLVPGELLERTIVGIDRVAAVCSCEGTLLLGLEPILDPRLRCPLCYLGSID